MATKGPGILPCVLKGLIFFYRIAPTVFEDGRKGVSVILEDITEQRRADDGLRILTKLSEKISLILSLPHSRKESGQISKKILRARHPHEQN
jgi:hypothetical protein